MHKIRPRYGVDDVDFGWTSDLLVSAGYFEDSSEFDEITGWRSYKKDHEIECYVKDDEVVCIACFDKCYLDNISLIGKRMPELFNELGPADEVGEPVWVTDDRQQIPCEYFSLGLQIWIESGKVVSVFCNADY